jgi:hypothetical protein
MASLRRIGDGLVPAIRRSLQDQISRDRHRPALTGGCRRQLLDRSQLETSQPRAQRCAALSGRPSPVPLAVVIDGGLAQHLARRGDAWVIRADMGPVSKAGYGSGRLPRHFYSGNSRPPSSLRRIVEALQKLTIAQEVAQLESTDQGLEVVDTAVAAITISARLQSRGWTNGGLITQALREPFSQLVKLAATRWRQIPPVEHLGARVRPDARSAVAYDRARRRDDRRWLARRAG